MTNDQRSNHLQSLNNLREAVSVAMESDDQLSDWLKFVFVVDYKQKAFVASLDGEETPLDDPRVRIFTVSL